MNELIKWLREYMSDIPFNYKHLMRAIEHECIHGWSPIPIVKEPSVIQIPSVELTDFEVNGELFWYVYMNNTLVIVHALPQMSCVIMRAPGSSYPCFCGKYIYDDRKNTLSGDIDGKTQSE